MYFNSFWFFSLYFLYDIFLIWLIFLSFAGPLISPSVSLPLPPPNLSSLLHSLTLYKETAHTPPTSHQMSRTRGAAGLLALHKGTWWVSLSPACRGFLPADQRHCQPFWICLLSKCSNRTLPGQITISELIDSLSASRFCADKQKCSDWKGNEWFHLNVLQLGLQVSVPKDLLP